jgi:hypothetical protein
MLTSAGDTQEAAPPMAVSAAAERMRRSRERKRKGRRLLPAEIRKSEVAALVKRGYLQQAQAEDNNEVLRALYKFLDQHLV